MLRKLLCAAALVVAGLSGAQASPVLSITPAASNVFVGDVFQLDIRISGVSDLYGWEMDLGFGPTGLTAVSPATEGVFLGAGQTFDGGSVDNGAGIISYMYSALSGPSGVTGDGILASIMVTALGVGQVDFTLNNILLTDSNLDTIFFDWPDNLRNAQVTISEQGGRVPEPSTLALALLALLGLSAGRRRVDDLTA